MRIANFIEKSSVFLPNKKRGFLNIFCDFSGRFLSLLSQKDDSKF
jgi:hypothetical protein